jgi:hypothetical protein
MLLHCQDTKGIPVVTNLDRKVGKLIGPIIETGTHSVFKYAVARSRLLSALLPDELLVDPSQVISLTAEQMIIKDEAIPAKAEAKKQLREAAQAIPASMRVMEKT